MIAESETQAADTAQEQGGVMLFYFGNQESVSLPGGNAFERFGRGVGIPTEKHYAQRICNQDADFQVLADGVVYIGGQHDGIENFNRDILPYLPSKPRILILRDNGAGDVIMSTVAVHALKAALPDSHITYATRPRNICILQGCPDVDNIVSIHNIHIDRAGEWDLIVNWCHALEWYKKERNRGPRIDSFLKHIGLYAEGCKSPWFRVSELNRVRARRLLIGAPEKRIAYVLQAASWNRSWPIDRVPELCRMMFRDFRDYGVVIIDSQPEAQFIRGENVINLAGKTKSFMEAAAVIEQCDAVITQDTGLAHAAGVIGIPSLVLIGSMVPEWRYSYYPLTKWIHPRGRAECCPCLDWSDRFEDGRLKSCNTSKELKCMNAITPGEIIAAVKGMLS